MLIFILDDEKNILEDTRRAVAEAAPEAEIRTFLRGRAALQAISEEGVFPDIVFSDIEMPGLSGLDFAVQLKTLSPDSRVVFVTGYAQYALEAFKVHAQGYLLKPADPAEIREELKVMPRQAVAEPNRLRVRCFGEFEVFWQGEPLHFERRRTKELFAFLIDREGASCTAEEAIAALWEDDPPKNVKQSLRNLVSDMRATFGKIGMGDVVIRNGRELAVRRELVDCDYYRMLQGDVEALNAFRGKYMAQYSWAELTAATLYFRDLE